MYGWSTVVKKRERSLLIGFSLGADASCSGRLRYRLDSSSLEFLRSPKGEEAETEVHHFIRILERLLKSNRIPWQITCLKYRSTKAEEGFDWMMHQIHV